MAKLLFLLTVIFTSAQSILTDTQVICESKHQFNKDPVVAFQSDSSSKTDDELFFKRFTDLWKKVEKDEPDQFPPYGFRINLAVYLDKSFQNKFGSQKISKLSKIFLVATKIFFWPSLGTTFSLDVNVIKEIDETIPLTESGLQRAGRSHSKLSKQDANIFFTVIDTSNLKDGALVTNGITMIETMCSESPELRTAIIGIDNSEVAAAVSLVHELGHMLGLKHDFETPTWRRNSIFSTEIYRLKRFDKRGDSCTNIESLMDYEQDVFSKWSTCSAEDLVKYYNLEIRRKGKFCLKESPSLFTSDEYLHTLPISHWEADEQTSLEIMVASLLEDSSFKTNTSLNFQKIFYEGDELFIGQIVNGSRQGFGKYVFPKNDSKKRLSYEGQWVKDEMQGKGQLYYQKGLKFEGRFSNGDRFGVGTVSFDSEANRSNITKYQSYWVDDLRQEEDTTNFYFKDGSSYKGEYILDLNFKYSSDVLKDQNISNSSSSYEKEISPFFGKVTKNGFGTWKNNKIDLEKMIIYTGGWKNDLMDGSGIYLFLKNNYVGDFKENLMDGNGTLVMFKGDTYIGQFKKGKKDGHGNLTKANGDNYVGEFKNDLKNGFGVMKFKDGRTYSGHWSADQMHGDGVMTKKDGSKEDGKWKYGKPQKFGFLTDSYSNDWSVRKWEEKPSYKSSYDKEFVQSENSKSGPNKYYFIIPIMIVIVLVIFCIIGKGIRTIRRNNIVRNQKRVTEVQTGRNITEQQVSLVQSTSDQITKV